MSGNAFRRARGFGHLTEREWTIYLVAAISAGIVPFLVIVLGLIVQLLVSRSGSEAPSDWVLGPIVSRMAIGRENYERYLMGLILVGGILAVGESLAVWAYYRLVHAWALRTSTKIKSEIRAQAFRIGPNDLLSVVRSRPEELFSDKAEALRRGLVRWRLAMPRSIFAVAVLLLLALVVNFWLTLLAISLAVIIWHFYAKRHHQFQEVAHGWHEEARQQHGRLLETFRLAPLISGYALQETPGERFEASLQQFEKTSLRAHMQEALLRPLLVLTILFAAALFLAADGLRRDNSVAGSAVIVTSLLCAYFPALRAYRLKETLEEAEHAASDIFTYLDREPGVGQIADAKPLERLSREIHFEKVILADRSGKKLLDEVSFTIAAGQRVAVLASDIQSPMALAGLFVRFYDPAAGRILFDGHDVRRATLDTVRGQAIFVSRDGPIFTGTASENLACGDAGFTSLQIMEAAKQIGMHEFLQELPLGYSTVLGEDDLRLPAPRAFVLGLTRAILRSPSVLVVEEPGNGLDDSSAAFVDAAIQAASKGRTVVILASRLATLRSADSVYVFHDGSIHAHGKHAELLQTSELYRHLNYMRFNPFDKGPSNTL